jgi:hypothetical protein
MSRHDELTPTEEDSPPPFEFIEHDSLVDGQRSLSLSLLDALQEEQQLPAAEEEELPNYESASLPLHENDRLRAPIVCYSLCKPSSKLQTLRPADELSMRRPWYNVVHRSSPSLFSKKPDMTMVRLTGTGRRGSAVAEEQQGDEVATMSFDRSSVLPYMPRACVRLGNVRPLRKSSNSAAMYKMSAPNFNDWKFALGAKNVCWAISPRPWALLLLDREADEVIARFTFSRAGLDAQKGVECGKFEVYSGYDTDDDSVIELILASCQIALQHFKSMGRHYRNDGPLTATRGGSVIVVPTVMGTAGILAPRALSTSGIVGRGLGQL